MNAVIYARYSSYGQNEQSIEGQLKDCHAYAVREGMTVWAETMKSEPRFVFINGMLGCIFSLQH